MALISRIECKMGDVVQLQQGLCINKKSKHLLVEEGIPLLRITDLIHRTKKQFIDRDQILEKFIAKKDDLIFTRTGQVGLIFTGREGVIHNNCFKIDPVEDVDKNYLYWFLKQEDIKELALRLAGGAAQPDLNHDAFKSISFSYPNLEEQKKTANILLKYENLIENNNRRIAILEDMAQSLYKEWFVKFRFPGHQNTKFKESSLGLIPEGWEVESLDEVASVNPENISNKNKPELIGYIDIKSVSTGIVNDIRSMRFSDAPSRARRIIKDGDIIWATVRPNRRQFSYICRPAVNTIASTGFVVLRAQKIPSSYLYFYTTTDNFSSYLVNHATGAAYPAVNAVVFEKASVLIPGQQLLDQFDQLSLKIIHQSDVLKKKNENLKKQRDLLLPKLVSGSINLQD